MLLDAEQSRVVRETVTSSNSIKQEIDSSFPQGPPLASSSQKSLDEDLAGTESTEPFFEVPEFKQPADPPVNFGRKSYPNKRTEAKPDETRSTKRSQEQSAISNSQKSSDSLFGTMEKRVIPETQSIPSSDSDAVTKQSTIEGLDNEDIDLLGFAEDCQKNLVPVETPSKRKRSESDNQGSTSDFLGRSQPKRTRHENVSKHPSLQPPKVC